MKKYCGLLFICILISCKPKTVENNGGLIIDLEISDINSTETDIISTVNILRNRIDYFCYYNPSITINTERNTIQIKLPLAKDSIIYKEYILKKGELIISETYENEEVYNCLKAVNDKLFENKNFNFEIPIDSLESSKRFPLFRIMRPALDMNGNPMPSPAIGYSEDTLLVNSILKYRGLRALFPNDIEFKWSKDKYGDMFTLIAIKKPRKYTPITSKMVLESRAIKNSSNYETTFTLKPEYVELWTDLTRNNIGKSIAIIVDNIVFSYPIVTSEIKGGRSTISSNMTIEESKALSTILQFGELPIELKIKQIKEIYVP